MKFQIACAAALGLAAAAATAVPAWSANDPISVARQQYRAECSRFEPSAWCECMGAGMAQSLTPEEMTLARMSIRDRHRTVTAARNAETSFTIAAAGLDPARDDAYERIREVETQVSAPCAVFRHDPPASAAEARAEPEAPAKIPEG